MCAPAVGVQMVLEGVGLGWAWPPVLISGPGRGVDTQVEDLSLSDLMWDHIAFIFLSYLDGAPSLSGNHLLQVFPTPWATDQCQSC